MNLYLHIHLLMTIRFSQSELYMPHLHASPEGGAAVEVVFEAAATEGVHAVRNISETFDVTARCVASLSIVYMTVILVFRYRRTTVSELAALGIGKASSNSIAGDGPSLNVRFWPWKQ